MLSETESFTQPDTTVETIVNLISLTFLLLSIHIYEGLTFETSAARKVVHYRFLTANTHRHRKAVAIETAPQCDYGSKLSIPALNG